MELTVDIDLIEFKDYYARAFQAAKQGIEIKGFRKGMAPDAVLEGVLDPKRLFDDAAAGTRGGPGGHTTTTRTGRATSGEQHRGDERPRHGRSGDGA